MKLLPKSEVTRLKAVETKTAIDEGLKIARKVDNLREVAAAEEVSLENFRRETVAKIHEETKEAAKERDTVKGELKVAKEELAEARKPLDSEWLQVADIKCALDREREDLDVRENLISKREEGVAAASTEVNNALTRAKSTDELATVRLLEATTHRIDAKSALEAAQKIKSDAEKEVRNTKNLLTNRETMVKDREDGVTLREAALVEGQKELADGWRLLRDREAMFERNLNRT